MMVSDKVLRFFLYIMATIKQLALENTLLELSKSGIILCRNGLVTSKYLFTSAIDCSSENMHLAMTLIPFILGPHAKESICSYGGKHVIERAFPRSHLSNGEFILICCTLGYKMITQVDELNVSFKAKWTKLAGMYQNCETLRDEQCSMKNGIKLYKFSSPPENIDHP